MRLRLTNLECGEQVRFRNRRSVGILLKGKTMMGRVLLIALSIGLSAEFGEALETAEHGLSAKALEIARPLNFPITNSMVVSWAVAIGLIAFAQIATRKMEQVPTGAQNFVEGLVEGLYNFLSGIIGPHLADR